VKGIFIQENASSTIYLVSCWEKQTCHQTLYQITFNTQFAYISRCVFAANYNFEEFVNLYGEIILTTSLLIKDSKTAGIFF